MSETSYLKVPRYLRERLEKIATHKGRVKTARTAPWADEARYLLDRATETETTAGGQTA